MPRRQHSRVPQEVLDEEEVRPSELSIEQLLSKRDALRNMVTSYMDRIMVIVSTEEADEDTYLAAEALLGHLQSKMKTLFEVGSSLEIVTSPLSLPHVLMEASSYEERALSIELKVKSFLLRHSKRNAESENVTVKRFKTSACNVRLPKINIDTFDGNYLLWQTFWSQFKITVHENDDMPVAQKFAQLTTLLKGEAADTIRGIAVVESNYPVVLKILETTYGRPEDIAERHLKQFQSVCVVKNARDVSSLRSFMNSVNHHVRVLKGMEKIDDTTDFVFSTIKSKLPDELTLMFSRLNNDSRSWVLLMDYIDEEVRRLENNRICKSQVGTTSTEDLKANKEKKGPGKWKTATVTTEGGFCVICETNGHRAKNCSSSKTLKEKKLNLQKKGRCFECLMRGHRANQCKTLFPACSECKGRHFKAMCPRVHLSKGKPEVWPYSKTTINKIQTNNQVSGQIILPTASVWVKGSLNECTCNLLLDTGSTVTLISKRLNEFLNGPIQCLGKQQMEDFSGQLKMIETASTKFMLLMKTTNKWVDFNGWVVDHLMSYHTNYKYLNQIQDCTQMDKQWANYNEPQNTGINIILGCDQMACILPESNNANKITILETDLGVMVMGGEVNRYIGTCTYINNRNPDVYFDFERLNLAVTQYLKLEDLTMDINLRNSDQFEVLEQFLNTIKFDSVKRRYVVCLPWIVERVDKLKSNKNVALASLKRITNWLSDRPNYIPIYDAAVNMYLKNGFAETIYPLLKVTTVFYNPLQAVYRPLSSTPVRIVFNASSHGKGELSLNDCLYEGPDRTLDIIKQIMNFRWGRWVYIADVAKAFLQIKIAKKDRDALRYLWPKVNNNIISEEIEEYRMCSLPFGLRPSPFILKMTLLHHANNLKEQFPAVKQIINEELYVDNIQGSRQCVQDLIDIHTQIIDWGMLASFSFTQWETNCDDLRLAWKVTNNSNQMKFLGLMWNVNNDHFTFSPAQVFAESVNNTKRGILSAVSRIYDPLGWLAPLTVSSKLLMQLVWSEGVSWDENLPANVMSAWQDWRNSMEQIIEISWPRWIGLNTNPSSMHIFCDASTRVFGTAAYVCGVNEKGEFISHLIMSKYRVTPKKTLTVPQLELMGVVLGARMWHYIQSNCNILSNVKLNFWLDSQIVLSWITSTGKKLNTFVRNRVDQIKMYTVGAQWRFCSSNNNVADIPTRKVNIQKTLSDTIWRCGPSWLKTVDNDYDIATTASIETLNLVNKSKNEISNEVKSKKKTIVDDQTIIQPYLIILKHVNSLEKGLRMLSWLKRVATRKSNKLSLTTLTTAEINNSLNWCIKMVQSEVYFNEIRCLSTNNSCPRTSTLYSLNAMIDENGVLRVKSRLQEAVIDWRIVHPIILPSKHRLTELLIQQTHEQLFHASAMRTLIELRNKYWIIRGKQTVLSIIRKCPYCLLTKPKSAKQTIAPLPSWRIQLNFAFETVGLDYAGPIAYCSKLTDKCKSYILLITCAASRSLHLELVTDASSCKFILALRRFCARRGVPRKIVTDNAAIFKKGSIDLNKVLVSEATCQFLSERRIEWDFITERAPWQGGFWERLVRSVKDPLARSLRKTMLDFEELSTLIVEIEAVINDRPLAPITDEIDNFDVITPSKIVLGRSLGTLPAVEGEGGWNQNIRDQFRIRKRLLNHYKQKWKQEYLFHLRTAHIIKPSDYKKYNVGELVLVNEGTIKLDWKLARIESVHEGRDGVVRTVTLKLPDKKLIRRPVQLISPLESRAGV